MKKRFRIDPLRGMAISLLTVAMPLSLIISCNRDKKEVVDVVFNPQTSYTLKEINSESLLSDSGITRYKLLAPTLLYFGKASEPYKYYPNSIYIEQFDTLFNIEASVKADTAYHYERRDLYELVGNVDITNFAGERLQTSQFFWDRKNHTVYTDSFFCLTKGETVQMGYGFRANEDLSKWNIINSSGEFLIESQTPTESADSIPVYD